MNVSTLLPLLRCPESGSQLRLDETGTALLNAARRSYPMPRHILSAVHPPELSGTDLEMNLVYDAADQSYDVGMQWLFEAFGTSDVEVRSTFAAELGLSKEKLVLNLGCGTGAESLYLFESGGYTGQMVNLDLSFQLLARAQDKLSAYAKQNAFVHANAAFLPFIDNAFDAVFHFGGINLFNDIPAAIAEMVRVAKPGARIVFGDEGLAPWLRTTETGKIVLAASTLYEHTPPMHLLPEVAQEVRLRYFFGNAYWVISFRKADPPSIDIHKPYPSFSKRGGTMYSRYQDSLSESGT